MSLEVSRSQLRRAILSGAQLNGDLMPLVENWWLDYKIWEEQDRFITAFKEGRMTIRQCEASLAYAGDDFGAGNMNVGSASREKYPGYKYAVGMDSLKDRLRPENFAGRKKYELGLHDMSGSLMDPEKSLITEQLRWKDETGPDAKLSSWISIFMPMAKPADMVLFYLVNAMAKKVRGNNAQIYGKVLAIRRSMSRIKLAAEEDIGAGLADISLTPHEGLPKFRYGLKADVGEDPVTKAINVQRQRQALNYTQIVELQRQKQGISNEIVIAFRHHAGERFPLYTKWVSNETKPVTNSKPGSGSGAPPPPSGPMLSAAQLRAKKQEMGRFVCLTGEPCSKYIIGNSIPNKWAQTQEVN
jgi:hypothetical protein